MSTNAMTFLSKADLIVLLKNGRMVETGKYCELIAQDGMFANFAKDYLSSINDKQEGLLFFSVMFTLSYQESDAVMKKDRTISELTVDEILDQIPFKNIAVDEIEVRKRQKSGYSLKNMVKRIRRRQRAKEMASQLTDDENDRRLIKDEHIETGGTQFKHVRSYFTTYGPQALLFPVFFLAALGLNIGTNIWLSEWSTDNSTDPEAPSGGYRAGIYALMGVLQGLTFFGCQIVISYGGYRAGCLLHTNILDRLIHAPIVFFDRTPLGRIINRMSKDIDSIDTNLPISIRFCIIMLISIITTLVVIAMSSLYFLIAIIPICAIFYFVQVRISSFQANIELIVFMGIAFLGKSRSENYIY